jgi:hypothetical protein
MGRGNCCKTQCQQRSRYLRVAFVLALTIIRGMMTGPRTRIEVALSSCVLLSQICSTAARMHVRGNSHSCDQMLLHTLRGGYHFHTACKK